MSFSNECSSSIAEPGHSANEKDSVRLFRSNADITLSILNLPDSKSQIVFPVRKTYCIKI